MEFGEKIEKAKAMFRQGRTRDLIWRQNQLRPGCFPRTYNFHIKNSDIISANNENPFERSLVLMLEENKERILTVLRNDLNKIDFEVEIELISVITEAAEGNIIDIIRPWKNRYL